MNKTLIQIAYQRQIERDGNVYSLRYPLLIYIVVVIVSLLCSYLVNAILEFISFITENVKKENNSSLYSANVFGVCRRFASIFKTKV